MSSPPIVQLSQILYHDVPSTAPLCSSSHHLARSGVNGRATTAAVAVSPGTTEIPERPARAVRLLLPRTFAVADRAYHDSIAAEKVGKVRERRVGAAGYGCCRRDSAPTAGEQQTSEGAGEEHDGCTGGSSGTTTCPTQHDDICSSQEPPRCSLRPATKAKEEGAVVVVVESVLGLSAVGSLLDQSYSYVPIAGVLNGRDVDASDAVSEAAGRLAGWLRIVAMGAALQRQGWPPHHRSSSSNVEKAARGKRRASLLDPDFDDDDFLVAAAAVATADGRAHSALYEVTGRCEAGEEWVSFDLEPTAAGAQGDVCYGADGAVTVSYSCLCIAFRKQK